MRQAGPSSAPSPGGQRGFTLVEVLVVVAIIGTLVAIAIPNFAQVMKESQNTSAVDGLKFIEQKILEFEFENGRYPDSLDELGIELPLDPWGRPYVYLRIAGGGAPQGHMRKDRFTVPINDDFDLYSVGPDGKSTSALTAKISQDDIIRGGNGSFFGTAADY